MRHITNMGTLDISMLEVDSDIKVTLLLENSSDGEFYGATLNHNELFQINDNFYFTHNISKIFARRPYVERVFSKVRVDFGLALFTLDKHAKLTPTQEIMRLTWRIKSMENSMVKCNNEIVTKQMMIIAAFVLFALYVVICK